MTDNDETVYKDLVGFLKSPRADIQEAATNAVFLASNTPDSHSKIIQYGAKEPLTKLISIPGKIGIQALRTLVNVTADDEEEAVDIAQLHQFDLVVSQWFDVFEEGVIIMGTIEYYSKRQTILLLVVVL